MSGPVYRAHQGLEVGDGVVDQGESLELRVTTEDPDMTVERAPDVIAISLSIHAGEVPNHDDIAVMSMCGLRPIFSPPKIPSKRSLRAKS